MKKNHNVNCFTIYRAQRLSNAEVLTDDFTASVQPRIPSKLLAQRRDGIRLLLDYIVFKALT